MGFFRSLPRVGQCCCCVDLRSGAIVIGIAQLFGSLSNLAMYIASYFINIDYNQFLPKDHTEEDKEKLETIINYVRYALIFLCIGGMCIGTLLIVAAAKGRILLLRVYLTILFILLLAFAIGVGFLYVYHWPSALVFTGIIAIDCYLFICINSYLQQLVDAKIGGTDVEFKAVPQA